MRKIRTLGFVGALLSGAMLLPRSEGLAQTLSWRTIGSHREASVNITAGPKEGFTQLEPRNHGIEFTNRLSDERSLTNQIYLNGSGVALGDANGDGLIDLYLCGLDSGNELYLNAGNWKFNRVTEQAGVACAGQASTGCAFADIDGDGDLDLFVNGIRAGTRLFMNDGKARFTEATREFGLNSDSGAMSLALSDVDGDTFLDLYVVNYRNSTFRDEPEKRFKVNNKNGQFELVSVDGRAPTEPDLLGRFTVDPKFGLVEHGQPDAFFKNKSGKYLEKVAWNAGTFLNENGTNPPIPYDWGLSAMFRDINGDGAPDLYVCNDFQSEDRIWINTGNGKFRPLAAAAIRHTSLFSMGVDFADIDRDGRDDFFVGDMLSREHARRQTQVMMPRSGSISSASERPQYPQNTLFWNDGNGRFREIAQLAGVQASEWSWSPAFLDVDLDGYEDLLVTAGHARDAQNVDVADEIEAAKKSRHLSWREQMEMRRRFPRLASPIMAFRNNRNLTFSLAADPWGFTSRQVANGMALGDLDNDGDLDLVVNCLNGPPLIYRNDIAAPRVAVRLKGRAGNSRGIGARITVEAHGLPAQTQEIICGGRYLSGDDCLRVFAATQNSSNIVVRVRWRSGAESLISKAKPNCIYEISEPDAAAPLETAKPEKTIPLFADISATLNHYHLDQAFDDFQRQPLLPKKLSQLGPGITWYDVDGNGWEDLVIGSGRTGKIGLYLNEHGLIKPAEVEALSRPGTRDRTTILGWRQNTNAVLLIGSANYEDGLTNGFLVRQFHWNDKTNDDSLRASTWSAGPLAMADADGDGDVDLFVGGRTIAGHYPEPSPSVFFRNEGGNLVLDEKASLAFQNLGLVSGAVWSELDGDASPELIVACDAGALRVFKWKSRAFHECTAEVGLNSGVGWWNSVATGDFDNDGRMDIVAGNTGRNTKYQQYLPGRYSIFFSESTGAAVGIIESISEAGEKLPMQNLGMLSTIFPELRTKYRTFAEFSSATVHDFTGKGFASLHEVLFTTGDSMIFLNRGSTFEARPLPLVAQFSPVFGIAVGDMDGDGNEDIFLAQNFYGTDPLTPRGDGGEGVALMGDGKGNFSVMGAAESGIDVPGEGRGAALSDFDHDGRLDLAVGQNSGQTKLFRNQSGKAGVRVELKGPSINPDAIGWAARAQYSDGSFGPRHEVKAGEGYWSQAAGSIVLSGTKPIAGIEIRSPSGATRVTPIDATQKTVVISVSE